MAAAQLRQRIRDAIQRVKENPDEAQEFTFPAGISDEQAGQIVDAVMCEELGVKASTIQ